MASIIKVTTTINATPQKVWEQFMNPDNLKHWLTGFLSAKHLSGTIGEAGSISQLKFMERGKEMEVTETVLFSNPNRQYTFRMESASFSTQNDIRLISFGNRTEIIQTAQFQPNGFFMKLIIPFIKGEMKKRMLNELLKLKNFIEKNENQ
ncbi:MAG TPA: SRPBCC family protein [Chitinophagaceae bacterium]|nr:SRPBCC family protein [Chitinophagaceae bacterium]